MVAIAYIRKQNCLFVHCNGDLKTILFIEDVLFYTSAPSRRMACNNALVYEAKYSRILTLLGVPFTLLGVPYTY